MYYSTVLAIWSSWGVEGEGIVKVLFRAWEDVGIGVGVDSSSHAAESMRHGRSGFGCCVHWMRGNGRAVRVASVGWRRSVGRGTTFYLTRYHMRWRLFVSVSVRLLVM